MASQQNLRDVLLQREFELLENCFGRLPPAGAGALREVIS